MVDHHPSKNANMKTKYRVVHSISEIFNGTSVEVSLSQSFLLCRCPEKVSIVDVASGATLGTIEGLPEDSIQCITLAPNEEDLVFCQRSKNMLLCSVSKRKMVKQWMGHTLAACVMRYHPESLLVAAGYPDATVMMWNPQKNTMQQKFKVDSIPLCMAFHPLYPQLLAVGDQVGTVSLYHCGNQTILMKLKDHLSHCTSMCFMPDGSRLLTCSRDKTVQVYDATTLHSSNFAKKVKSWVIVEEILSLAPLQGGNVLICGSSGKLRTYEGSSGKLLSEAAAYPHPFVQCHYLSERSEAIVVTADQCILFYTLSPDGPAVLDRTLAGNLDAIGDIRWLEEGKRFIVVTNSLNPRIYCRNSNFCEELHGHTDIPGSLAVTSDSRYVASAGKDKEIRIWTVSGPRGRCIGQLTGHLSFITALAFTHTVVGKSNLLLLISVDMDGFARIWNLSALLNPKQSYQKMLRKSKKKKATSEQEHFPDGDEDDGEVPEGYFITMTNAETTLKASEASLNALAVAPNNALVAGGGKAKVVYVWKLLGNALTSPVPLKGHKRAITAVQFSPVDKLLVSCCSHGHAMLWNLVDYQCIRTLQNEKGVGMYQARFMNHGIQLATTDSQGMLKLWVIRTAECSATISGHSDDDALRDVWALDVTPDDQYIITGGTDSRINILKDFTEADRQTELAQKQINVLETQQVQNLMRQGKWEDAVLLALKLKRKNDLRIILANMAHQLGEVKGPARLEAIIATCTEEQLSQILRYCRDWNTHSQHCHVAQAVLCAVFRVIPPAKLAENDALSEILEALVAYNSRHFTRLTSLLQKTYLLDYTLSALVPLPSLPPAKPVTTIQNGDLHASLSGDEMESD